LCKMALALILLAFLVLTATSEPRIHKLKKASHYAGQDPSAQNVTYHGLKLMSNPKVLVIFWGTFDSASQTKVLQFYRDLAPSRYVTWANNSYGVPPNNLIGPGQLIEKQCFVTDTQKGNKITTLTQTQVKNQVLSLRNNTCFSTPDYSTYYAVHFAKYIKVSGFGSTFCAYHDFVNDTTGTPIPFGVINNNSLVKNVCGTGWNDMTSYSSHEFIEAITDPYWDINDVYGGWWAPNNNENMDNCNWIECTMIINGNNYTVQQQWVNSNNGSGCVSAFV